MSTKTTKAKLSKLEKDMAEVQTTLANMGTMVVNINGSIQGLGQNFENFVNQVQFHRHNIVIPTDFPFFDEETAKKVAEKQAAEKKAAETTKEKEAEE